MSFSTVVGQEKVSSHLEQVIETGRIHHAQIFVGDDGRGPLPIVLEFAKLIVSQNSADPEASQLKCDKFIHPDIHFVFPVNTNKKVKKDAVSAHFLEEWRAMLGDIAYPTMSDWLERIDVGNKQVSISVKESEEIVRFLSLKPYESQYRVVVVWNMDKMNPSASNKLLKAIEEPPERAIFLMTASTTEGMLQTILSRSQIHRLPPISSGDLTNYLIEKEQLFEDRAFEISNLAEGSMTRALELLRQEGHDYTDQFKTWMRLCVQKKVRDLTLWIDQISGIGREAQKNLLNYGLQVFRESVHLNYVGRSSVHFAGDELEFLRKFAPYVNHNNVHYFQKEFDKAVTHIGRNANPKILFMDLSITIIKLFALAQKE